MLEHKSYQLEIKSSDDDSRIVKGYASYFGNKDSDMDIIQKGAYTKNLEENGHRVKLYAQHDMNRPIGKITKLEETDNGLYMEAKFGTHSEGEDYYRMAKEGILDEFSVGFKATKKDKNEHGGYDIKEIKLYEVSMVSYAANENARVMEVKSEDVLKLVKQIEDKDLAFKLERDILKMMSSQETSTEAESNDVDVKEDSLEPDVEVKDINVELLNLFKNGR